MIRFTQHNIYKQLKVKGFVRKALVSKLQKNK